MKILAGLLAVALLAACSEKPQLLVPAAAPEIERQNELRERALNQDESDRMSY